MLDNEINQRVSPPCWEQLGKNILTYRLLGHFIYVYKVIVFQNISIIQQGDTEHTLAVYGPISRINPFGMPQNRLELLRLVSYVLDSKPDSPITVVSRYRQPKNLSFFSLKLIFFWGGLRFI